MGELLGNAALNTLIGMGTVFVVLILISFIIYLFKLIHSAEEKLGERKKNGAEAATEQTLKRVSEAPVQIDRETDTELVAVISAAIAAYEGTASDGIIVRSIRRVSERKQERRG